MTQKRRQRFLSTGFQRRKPKPRYNPEEALHLRRVYIFPTRNGLWFTGILSVMLFGAMNYNNSMAFVLTFLLGGMALVSILYTYRNLSGLRITAGVATPVFAGDAARFALRFNNQGQLPRIALRLIPNKPPEHWRAVETIVDIPENTWQTVFIACPTRVRGRERIGEIRLETTYPLGLIRAWTYLNLDLTCLVYPRPEGAQPLPPGQADAHREGGRAGMGGDDFVGYRDYRLGDSPRHVDWKIVAKDKGWLIKQFGGQSPGNVWLEWSAVSNQRDAEAVLSQLCQWVLAAEQAGIQYGLRLAREEFAPAWGDEHRQRCLQSLALFGMTR